jgi:hypothetical protein
MNANGDLGRRLSDHYASEAPHRAPDWLLDSAIDIIDTTPQRRVLFRAPWRSLFMNTNAKLGVAAVVAVVLVGGAIALLRPGASSGPGSVPSAGPSPALSTAPSPPPSPAATPISTADWVPFTSTRYGYQLAYPASHAGVTGSTTSAPTEVISAQRDFVIGTDRITVSGDDIANDWFILGPDGNQIGVAGFAGTVPDGMSEDELIDASFGPCPGRATEAVTVDGHPGRLDVGCELSIATVVIDDRAYVFAEGHGVYQDLLKAFLSTVRLPISTADWVPFSSGRYGYTAAYPATSAGMPGSTGSAPTEVVPASRYWSIENDGEMFTTIETAERAFQATDLFVMGPDGSQIAITGFAGAVPAGMSKDEWIATYNEAQNRPEACSGTIDWRPVTVDGLAGRLDPCADAQAFVFRDGVVYVFSIWQPDQVALLEAFLSTVKWKQ